MCSWTLTMSMSFCYTSASCGLSAAHTPQGELRWGRGRRLLPGRRSRGPHKLGAQHGSKPLWHMKAPLQGHSNLVMLVFVDPSDAELSWTCPRASRLIGSPLERLDEQYLQISKPQTKMRLGITPQWRGYRSVANKLQGVGMFTLWFGIFKVLICAVLHISRCLELWAFDSVWCCLFCCDCYYCRSSICGFSKIQAPWHDVVLLKFESCQVFWIVNFVPTFALIAALLLPRPSTKASIQLGNCWLGPHTCPGTPSGGLLLAQP